MSSTEPEASTCLTSPKSLLMFIVFVLLLLCLFCLASVDNEVVQQWLDIEEKKMVEF